MKTRLSVLALVAAVAITGCGKEQQAEAPKAEAPAGPAVAVVNGEPITEATYEAIVDQVTQGQPERVTPEAREQLINRMIDITLLAQEAEKQGVDKDPKVAAILAHMENEILAQGMQKHLADQGVDEATLKAEYEKRFGGANAKTEYHARHILVDTKKQAEDIIKKLDKGADFGELAKTLSKDKASGADGGDLSWFEPERMVPEFSAAVETLKPGTYTKEPVQTSFGWHVIKLEETRAAPPPSLEDVKPQLENALIRQKIEQHLENLRKNAKIEIKPAATAEAKPEAAQPQAAQPQAAQPEQSQPAQSEQAAPAQGK